jgi:hypothetical protein
MSWIKDNQFIVTLGGITLVGAAALIFFGLQGLSRYEAAAASYQDSTTQAGTSESLPLYPSSSNKDGKSKALGEYRDSVTTLQNAFTKFRPAAVQNIAPQEFTNQLKGATAEVQAAFQASKATLPESFFSGFENYTGALAKENATGILGYELGAAKELLLSLAKSSPAQLTNFYRTRLPEEEGGAWKPADTDIARPLSFEVTFKGSEKSARAFLSSLAKSENYFYVVRTVAIANEKKTPPLASDAQFEPAPTPDTSTSSAAPASGGFVFPSDNAAPAAGAAAATPAAAAPAAAAATPAPAAPAPDSGRILSQVLGNEDIQVFVRVDVLQFLPVKALPQP